MTKVRRLCLFFVLLSGAISVFWGFSIGLKNSGGPTDFQAVYFGARCLLQHHNPYSVNELAAVYAAAKNEVPLPTERQRKLVELYVNMPTSFVIFAPFEFLPLRLAQIAWMLLTATSLVLSGVLFWGLCSDRAPVLSACLIGFLLVNCEYVFSTGNTGGLVVGLALVATWCFLEERFVLVGILCMSVSLAIKPHDGGLIWLYFLMSGGIHRKRALQVLTVTIFLGILAVLWLSLIAPSWMNDWQTNLTAISQRGSFNDPGPTAVVANSFAKVISLQAVFSVFRDDPKFYNAATYVVCVPLLLVWLIVTLRSRSSREKDWLALAAIVPLTLLVTYHRVYDAKLVLLTVPACAMVWARGGPVRWIALGLSAAGVVVCSDIPLILLEWFAQSLHLSTGVLSGQILTVALGRSATDILLLVGVFYLWVYVRSAFSPPASVLPGDGKIEHSASAVV
jgi:hypothetical protein